ncbi:major facilitator superfamily transporter [Tritrichomonas foetus]|uniref:Major facilitator superfamily transporter n=1 Tax=Tritrichomonas foetus TaxID=1144522 RepID=A0A1J4JW50_9EUKA|nr:major facilitator superfamily transporter [Tritrichomonas foetus]|eukprot:OHT03359.1 major facilitator superfamily transporter [Tritrichomonas foetus]
MNIPKISIPIISGLLLMMGGISTGLTLAYPSPASSDLIAKFDLSSIQNTMFNVSGLLAALAGAVVINIIIPIIGKNSALLLTAFINFGSFLGIGLSNSMWLIFFMRCLNGMTLGCFSTICPVYLCEIAPEEKINSYGFLNQIGLSIGFLLPSLFGFFSDYSQNALLCMIPSVILFLGCIFIPSIKQQEAVKVSPLNVFKFPKEFIIAVLLMFFLQFSGINALLSNLETIITNSKIDMNTSLVAVIANIVQICSTIFASFLVDRFGNKICWIVSTAGQAIAFILLCLQQKLNLPGPVFLVGLFLEQLTYGIGTGPIPFSLTSQLFPVEVKPSAMGICTGISWAFSAIICFLWPVMEDGMGLGYSFLFFACVSLLAVLFGVFLIQSKPCKDVDTSSSVESIERRLSKQPDEAEL